MTPAEWARIEAVFDAALDLPAAERDAWLADSCADEPEVLAEVRRLLAAHDAADGPLPSEPTASDAALFAAPLLAETLGRDVGADGARAPARRRSDRIGAWRIITQVGEGGMGTVYMAERDDGAFRMRAALKLVRGGLHLDPKLVRRFRDERQILASLDHPGIARVIDGGVTADGVPYSVMEFVEGEPIDRWCDARRLSLEGRLALFTRVCDAVAAAHRVGIVHRDIKPSNVLVTADGQPKLLDFGIAKALAEESAPDAVAAAGALTRTGERLLTPEYASPEQLRGATVTAATDVYSLGVLLCELLTGRRPHAREGRPRHEIDRAVLEEAAPRPSSMIIDETPASGEATTASARAAARSVEPDALRQRLRGDLDAIVLMSLRKEPERRYAGAEEFAADVHRHLERRPVHARGDAIAYRARTWVRRHRRLAVAGGIGMLAGIAALGPLLLRSERRTLHADEVAAHGAVARRFYEDGMRAYARGNWSEAARALAAAVDEDSTFVLAALYASEAAARDENYLLRDDLLRRAIRVADFAPTRERLVVRAFEAYRLRTPSLRIYADSLLALDPSDLEAQLADARADFVAGSFADAITRNHSIVRADSVDRADDSGPCYACQAFLDLITAYMYADSMDAALREAIALTEWRPDAASSWRALALVRQRRGELDESAYRRAIELDPADADYAAEWLADTRIRHADFAAADEVLRSRMRTAPTRGEERALWTLVTSLRNQERWAEALDLARRYRATTLEPPSPGAAPAAAVLEAQVLLESGRPVVAAALYDSIARLDPAVPGAAGSRIWHLAHEADALVEAGDTASLAVIADSIRTLGRLSGYARDQRLEHHVRGLLHAARDDHSSAADHFRRAVFSSTHGYTRTNLALARSLMRLGRHDEAAATLQAALRGSIEVNNLYVTHTAVHRELANAFRAAGRADSARVHEAWVQRATMHADRASPSGSIR